MREIVDVIDQLIEVLPKDGNHFIAEQQLLTIRESIPFTPPEGMKLRWEQVQEAVNRAVDSPLSEKWQVSFVSIFTNLHPEDVAISFALPHLISFFRSPKHGGTDGANKGPNVLGHEDKHDTFH